MARVRLSLEHEGSLEYRFQEPAGADITIRPLRLRARVDLLATFRPDISGYQRQYAFCPCIIDTGSPLTTIPYRVWNLIRNDAMTNLEFAPESHRLISLAGATFRFEPKQLSFRIRDWDECRLFPPTEETLGVTAIVMCLDEFSIRRDVRSDSLPMILGLQGGALDRLALSCEKGGQTWWLEDP